MQRTGCLDKNVVNNHKFTSKCSPNVYLPTIPFPRFVIFCGLQIWSPQITLIPRTRPSHGELRTFLGFRFNHLKLPSSPSPTVTPNLERFLDFRFGYLKLPILPPNFKPFFELQITAPPLAPDLEYFWTSRFDHQHCQLRVTMGKT